MSAVDIQVYLIIVDAMATLEPLSITGAWQEVHGQTEPVRISQIDACIVRKQASGALYAFDHMVWLRRRKMRVNNALPCRGGHTNL